MSCASDVRVNITSLTPEYNYIILGIESVPTENMLISIGTTDRFVDRPPFAAVEPVIHNC